MAPSRLASFAIVLWMAGLAAQAATPALSSGDRHSVALKADGTVHAWGNDAAGQLGTRLLYSPSLQPVTGLGVVTEVAAGRLHSLALRGDKTLAGWGYNAVGPVGDGTATNRARPVDAAITGVSGIAAGSHFSLAYKADGTLWAWGGNSGGNLGDGTFMDRWTPVQVPGISGVVGVAAGWAHSIALRSDKTVWTWGENDRGQLGTGAGPKRATPMQVPGLAGVKAVAAGFATTAALKEDGTVWTWGWNYGGQLGDGTTVDRSIPAQVPGLTNVAAIAVAGGYVLALKLDGTVWAWGDNYNGSLGDGTRTSRSVPAIVPGLSGIARVAVGGGHSLAVASNGAVWAWGNNDYGQVGDGTTAMRLSPAQVPGITDASRVAAGESHSIVARANGAVVVWGSNLSGILGDGAPITRTVPQPVSGLSNVAALGANSSGDANLAIKGDGSLWAWGSNFCSQLGDGTYTTRSTPAQVPGLSNVVEAAGGACFSLARVADGGVYTWGDGLNGQLGRGAFVGDPLPTRIPAFTATRIAAGLQHAVALDSGGNVWTWGRNNHGQLADGTVADRASPFKVPGLTNVIAISAGGYHTLAVKADGSVWAWGYNYAGQVGDGTTADRLAPFQVGSLTGVVAVANGLNRSMALKSDGTVWSWGDGTGVDNVFNSKVPIQVAGPANVARIACGNYHSIAVTTDGAVWTWADNAFGHLGDGTYVARLRPVVVLADGGAGAIDTNDWYLDLDPSVATTIPAAARPKALAVAQLAGTTDRLDLDSRMKYRAADFSKPVNLYVLALVPPEFLDQVRAAPGAASAKALRAKAGGTLVLVQLTPNGWADVNGQIIAYAQGVANAAGSATRILDGINATQIPGARFCVGYGDSADSMLTSQSLREVLALEGASASASGVACVLSGVYVSGPVSSLEGTPVRFDASVVGLSPSGSVQFIDGVSGLQGPMALSSANEAVAHASVVTSALGPGVHSIAATYSGDGQNPGASTEIPLAHEVKRMAAGATTTVLWGPVSSNLNDEVTFTAVVTGNNPTGSVQFKDGGVALGAPVPVVGGTSILRIATLGDSNHSLTAQYTGDSANAPSTSNTVFHLVMSDVRTRVLLEANPNPSAFGAPVNLTATVTGLAPKGSVTFRVGPANVGTIPLSGGVASLSLIGLPAGTHELTASYPGGDGFNPPATSNVVLQQVRVQSAGTAPSPFTFASRAYITPGSSVVSNPITVRGIGAAVPIVVTGGEYSLGCGSGFTSASSLVGPGQVICVRHTAAGTTATSTSTTLTIGGISATFTSTTYPASFPSSVSTFVAHYYDSILRRSPDAGGQAFWASEATRVAGAGAGVSEGFFALAMSFYNSAEYIAFNRNDAAFVTDLYNTFFNRAPDSAGLAFWLGNLGQGMPREVALAEFMFSTEFGNFTQAAFGDTAARAEVDAVMDFYRGLLARLPDDAGFGYWRDRFRMAQCQGTAAVTAEAESISSAFALSAEYGGRNRSNAQYVGDLYNAFLRRGGDLAGVQFWIGQLNSAAQTREQLRAAFKNSAEFQARVSAVIQQGCLQ